MRRSDVISIRAISPDEWRLFRSLRLAALEEAPDAFSTPLSQWKGEGDAELRWRRRLITVPLNLVAYLDGRPVGLASGTSPTARRETELISMWVAPFARRKGIGAALIDAVISWAKTQGFERVTLDVREANAGAIGLYAHCGFIDSGRVEQPGPPERRMARAITPNVKNQDAKRI